MEQETMLKEILNVLKTHGEQMDSKFEAIDKRFTSMDKKFISMDKRFESIDKRFKDMDKKMDGLKDDLRNEMHEGFKQVNQRIDRLTQQIHGVRADLTETQENTNFLLSKTVQHEKKIQQMMNHQQ
jgi:chromosome segregation ATPase